jgi:hypothetical protein
MFRLEFDSWLERFFFLGQKGLDSLESQNSRLDPQLSNSEREIEKEIEKEQEC